MNRMVLNDEESGISVDMTASDDLPDGVAARRFQQVLDVVAYHRFQSGGDNDD